MPLIQSKSKKAFSKNVEAEMHEGKPQKQSLAIAFSVQRRNNKKKKMAFGGAAEDTNEPSVPSRKPNNERLPKDEYMADHFAHGGEVEEHYESIADAILAKKRQAASGQADLNEHSEEQPNQYDGINMDTANKEQYDDSQLEAQPEDSNLHGDDIESDKHDMVSQIRRKMKLKARL